MHTPLKAGIWGGKDGAYSIVMSGGYEYDEDLGETVYVADHLFLTYFTQLLRRTYTGTGGFGDENRYGGGGNSWGKSIQTENQSFDHKDNRALLVRVQCSILEREKTRQRSDCLIDILRTGRVRPGYPGVRPEDRLCPCHWVRGQQRCQ